jgi:hypothetical protein
MRTTFMNSFNFKIRNTNLHVKFGLVFDYTLILKHFIAALYKTANQNRQKSHSTLF